MAAYTNNRWYAHSERVNFIAVSSISIKTYIEKVKKAGIYTLSSRYSHVLFDCYIHEGSSEKKNQEEIHRYISPKYLTNVFSFP